jgi:gas vesicle protein
MHDRTPGRTSLFSWMFCVLWVLGFLAGGAAGASVALLLSPQSGGGTRETMRRKLKDTAGFARDLRDRLIRRGQRTWDETRPRVDDAAAAVAAGTATLPG